MKLILNELTEAKKIIQNRKVSEDKNESIKILIKYYKYKGMAKEKARNAIENILNVTLRDFNSVKMGDYLDGLVNSCYKNDWKLVQRDDILITQKEIESIKKLNDRNLEKLCFTMLIMCKADNLEESKYGFWVNRDINEIFLESGIKRNLVQQDAMIRKIRDLGYVDLSSNVRKMGMKINYVDKIDNYTDNEVLIKLNKFEQLDLVYLRLIGEKIVECEECGILIEVKNGRPNQYCNKCSNIKKLESKRKHWEKLNTRQ